MIETDLNGQTPNIAEENITKLKTIFPDVFTEGKVDFEKLQQVLGNYIETSNERYNFSWNGKAKALRLAQTPSMGTLRPCKEESKDWDTTQNLYIEGDNLEVLKLLQKSYHGKIKMIYIDPPYNTGGDFVYPDNYTNSIENYKIITGQIDSDGKSISSNSETSGRYHTDWLNMMYPRLRLARNLLSDNGVVFLSIDDNEVDNLRKICTEIFGEVNFVGCIAKKTKLTSNNGTFFAPSHEYVLVYAKQIGDLEGFDDPLSQEDPEYLKLFKYEDEYSKYNIVGLYQPSLTLERSRNARYFIDCPDGSKCIPPEGKRWRVIESSYFEMVEKKVIVFKETKTSPLMDENAKQSKWNIYTKIYLKDRLASGMRPVTFLDKFPNSEASKELIKLQIPFDFSKPRKLIQYLIKICNCTDNIILDFFSGSATTAHAVMELNAEDGGNRKFIMVQLPETTDENSEAFKAKYTTICEIGKERISRSGEKIKEAQGSELQSLDIGFKVLKLDSSNIRKWQPDYENLEFSLTDFLDNYLEGRTEFDVVYEIMLKYGIDLTYPVDEHFIVNKIVYSIGFGMLIICLDNEITTEIAKGILDLVKELAPETTRVVFKDNGFKTDSNKTNIKEILKCGGIEEFITL